MRWDIFRQLRQRNLVEDDQEGITLVRSVLSDLNHGDRYQLDYLGENVGKLEYRTCSICGEGTVLKISVYHQVKGCGVGGYLIRHLVQRDPDLAWNTTWQYPDAEGFWRHMSEACRQPFAPVGKNCDHANSSAGLLDGYTFRVPHRPVAG